MDGRAIFRDSVHGWMSSALSNGFRSPAGLVETAVDMLWNAGKLVELMLPGATGRSAWKESRNKLRAFALFVDADRKLGVCRSNRLREFVPGIDALDPYSGIWTTEGLGYYYALQRLREADQLQVPILANAIQDVPARCWIPLHTGMGLALASIALPQMVNLNSAQDLRRHLKNYIACCRANACRGYAGTGLESLGLVAGISRRELLNAIDRELLGIDELCAAQFWHGYGRGLYFAPGNLIPWASAIWPSAQFARNEPPHRLARINALAGLAWAASLVNIRNPEVIDMFITRNAQTTEDFEAFADGIRSAAAVWRDWSPKSPILKAICEYKPSGIAGSATARWNQIARGHCNPEFERSYRYLRDHAAIDQLFHYRAHDAGVVESR